MVELRTFYLKRCKSDNADVTVSSKDLLVEVIEQLSNPGVRERLEALHHNLTSSERRTRTRRTKRQQQRRLNPDDQQALVLAYQQGAGVDDLIARFGIHRATIFSILKRAGVKRRQPAFDARTLQEVALLYRSGLSLKVIAQQFGVNPSTVWRHLQQAGVVMRDTQGRER